jgi:hypothetical protein
MQGSESRVWECKGVLDVGCWFRDGSKHTLCKVQFEGFMVRVSIVFLLFDFALYTMSLP